MTNAKRGCGSHRWVYLCAAAALGIALSGCGAGGGSGAEGSAAMSAPAPASAAMSAPARAAMSTPASAATSAPPSGTASGNSNLPTASTGAVTINWTPPTEDTNGTAVTNLVGYAIHYGTASQDYAKTITVSNPGIATYVVDDLKPGTYFFSVAAIGSDGTESPLSAEVTATVN